MENQTITIKTTEPYKYRGEEYIVCKGKLIFIWGDCRKEEFYKYGLESHDKTQFAKPIIISETEEFKEGDIIAHHEYGIGKVISRKATGKYWICKFDGKVETETVIGVFKIIAFPENFSPEIIQIIIDGKLKDGSEVWVKVEKSLPFSGYNKTEYRIDLDTNNHISLIEQKEKEESWDDIFLDFYGNNMYHSLFEDKEKKLFMWLTKNYNPPIRKVK